MLEFVLSLLIIFWLVGAIGKFLFRRWLRSKQRQFEEKFNYQKQYQEDYRRQEGDVTINGAPNMNKRINDNVGEYVDFEDVKESDRNEH